MMRFVRSRPGEFLVVGRGGELRNLGVGAWAWLGAGATCVCVPTGKEEAVFSMVQETADGIPLQFKGSVVYRVVDPVAAALAFEFETPSGPERLRSLIASICLAELRDVTSHMTMKACIEERKTTLTSTVAEALESVLKGGGSGDSTSWGVAVDVALIAQVFVVDPELRSRLEAEERAALTTRSRRAEIQRDEDIQRAEVDSARRLEAVQLERAQESNDIAREKLKLKQALELESQAADARVREDAHEHEVALARRRAEADAQEARENLRRETSLAQQADEAQAERRRVRLEEEREVAELALEVGQRELELHQLQVKKDTLRARADAEVERDLLPQRQLPQIAEALAGIYNGATLSIYSSDDALGSKLLPIFDHLMQRVCETGDRDAS